MIPVDYSRIRYELTEALRHLQLLEEQVKAEDYSEQVISEVSYWVTTLELIRNCLYDCTDYYYGEMDIQEAVEEIKEEMLAAFVEFSKCRELKTLVQYRLTQAWQKCKVVEKLL